jgi:transcriptional regulator with XRE-family HTH domain
VATVRSPAHAAFGRAVREFRKEQRLSQEELGHRSGLHRNHIGGIERGELNPSLETIARLARALSTKPSELFCRAERRGDIAP